jgi:hypothetical protein
MADYCVDQSQNIVRVLDGATIPADPNNRDYAAYLAWVNAGNTVDPDMPSSRLHGDYEAVVLALLDTTARQRNYDDILSACSYVASTSATFRAEADACVAWRDAVWAQCYADLAAAQTGQKAQATVADFVASLPQLTWPS